MVIAREYHMRAGKSAVDKHLPGSSGADAETTAYGEKFDKFVHEGNDAYSVDFHIQIMIRVFYRRPIYWLTGGQYLTGIQCKIARLRAGVMFRWTACELAVCSQVTRSLAVETRHARE